MRLNAALAVAALFVAICCLTEGKRQSSEVSKRSPQDDTNDLEVELSRVKRGKRSSDDPELTRVKRQDVDDEEALNRVKRYRREIPDVPLYRTKRHRRNAEDLRQKKKESKKEAPNAAMEKEGDGEQNSLEPEKASLSKKAKKNRAAHRGHLHSPKSNGPSELKKVVKKAIEKAKKNHPSHTHSRQEKFHAKYHRQKKSKKMDKKSKFAKELFQFKRLKRALTHGVVKKIKHLNLLTNVKSAHIKRAKRSKVAKHPK